MLHENEAAEILFDICKNDNMIGSEIKEGKIELIADCNGLFRVDVDRLDAINELDEIITKNLKWQQIGKDFDINGEEQAIMGFAESYSSYSQNLEKAIEKQEKFKLSTEKLENKLLEYKKSFEILQVKLYW